jgi:hypothetical protein
MFHTKLGFLIARRSSTDVTESNEIVCGKTRGLGSTSNCSQASVTTANTASIHYEATPFPWHLFSPEFTREIYFYTVSPAFTIRDTSRRLLAKSILGE